MALVSLTLKREITYEGLQPQKIGTPLSRVLLLVVNRNRDIPLRGIARTHILFGDRVGQLGIFRCSQVSAPSREPPDCCTAERRAAFESEAVVALDTI